MSKRLRVLITGFGAFPGAPYNPTERLVDCLARRRRPALSDVTLIKHIFRVSYTAVDHDLPLLLASPAPDAILMFGLAQRTPFIRIETRARNAVTMLWPDADHTRVKSALIAEGNVVTRNFGPHTTQLLRVARSTGAWTVTSRDAGHYLCNYLGWRAIEATKIDGGPRLAAFVHVPLIPRDAKARHCSTRRHVSFAEMLTTGEALLMTLVKLTRQQILAAGRD